MQFEFIPTYNYIQMCKSAKTIGKTKEFLYLKNSGNQLHTFMFGNPQNLLQMDDESQGVVGDNSLGITHDADDDYDMGATEFHNEVEMYAEQSMSFSELRNQVSEAGMRSGSSSHSVQPATGNRGFGVSCSYCGDNVTDIPCTCMGSSVR